MQTMQTMPSITSIGLFLAFNTFIGCFSYIQYIYKLPTLPTLLAKHLFVYMFVVVSSSKKESLNTKTVEHISMFAKCAYFIQAVTLEYVAYICIPIISTSLLYDCIVFIPLSFIFEVLFDFMHYVMHRMSHRIPQLYKYHSLHHSHSSLQPISAFKHHWIDLVLTNTLPLIIAGHLIPMSSLTLNAILWYKVLVEIGGHCGKNIKGSSFPQCIWLPRLLSIELYSKDHANHHRYGNKNYSKRFMLWDKVFGTNI